MVNGISVEKLAQRYRRLYHMAAGSAWEGIRRHGLLSTSSLLDLFEIHGAERDRLEAQRRPSSMTISHRIHGYAVLRDQKPMSESKLAKCLLNDLQPADWYRCLNEKVFFWVEEDRLHTLLNAREYRDTERLVLVIDTEQLLKAHEPQVLLCPMNSGSTSPYAHPRGSDTFLPLSRYPFETRRKKGLQPVVELAVSGGVPDIAEFVISATELSRSSEPRVVFTR